LIPHLEMVALED